VPAGGPYRCVLPPRPTYSVRATRRAHCPRPPPLARPSLQRQQWPLADLHLRRGLPRRALSERGRARAGPGFVRRSAFAALLPARRIAAARKLLH
jgi:hypothetical protein